MLESVRHRFLSRGWRFKWRHSPDWRLSDDGEVWKCIIFLLPSVSFYCFFGLSYVSDVFMQTKVKHKNPKTKTKKQKQTNKKILIHFVCVAFQLRLFASRGHCNPLNKLKKTKTLLQRHSQSWKMHNLHIKIKNNLFPLFSHFNWVFTFLYILGCIYQTCYAQDTIFLHCFRLQSQQSKDEENVWETTRWRKMTVSLIGGWLIASSDGSQTHCGV